MLANHWNVRTELLLGDEKLNKLKNAKVMIVGLGGVGAAAAEMIARAGVGNMVIVDCDVVEQSNRNRQLGALISTNGIPKVEAVGNRLKDINSALNLAMVQVYLINEAIPNLLDNHQPDYVIDAIDTLTPKIYLIKHVLDRKIKLVSSMGAGGKMDPSQVVIGDIADTYNCKLARYVRKRLHQQGIFKGVKVIFSTEKIDRERVILTDGSNNKKSVIGTISYLPPIFGCFCASVAINDLIK
jgi:tRNA A37 threonylcarbamoyladenosine dehydratase